MYEKDVAVVMDSRLMEMHPWHNKEGKLIFGHLSG
jgi:hypothetical protein